LGLAGNQSVKRPERIPSIRSLEQEGTMNPRGLILLTLAAIGVVLVVFLTRSFLSSAQQQARDTQLTAAPQEATSKILVAKRDLHVGTILSPEDTEWKTWPKSGLNDAYFTAKTDKKKALSSQVVRLPLAAGEPVTKTSVVKQGERGFLAAILSPGMRAVTIKLSPTTGIGGFIFPGDRVDVLLTHAIEISREEQYQIAETVFQNVRVLAVDQKSASDDKAKIGKTATLEVTPKMAEKVAMLGNIGQLSLSLRSLSNSGGGLTADPSSPPVTRTTSHSMGSEISAFLPKLNEDTPTNSVRVTRGSRVSTVDTDARKKEGADQ
jgi:pilus assembly protein CpaB